jgi:hypothetical protein
VSRQLKRKSQIARKGSVIGGSGDPEDVVPFEVRGFSLAQLFLALGAFLVIFSFGDYFITGVGGQGTGIGAIVFIYAVPVLLLGAALVYAELQPVEAEFKTDEKFWEGKATPTLLKVFNDVTRHRYGDDAHLDTSLKALGLTVSRGRYPKLLKIVIDKSEDEELEFTLLFESKDVPYTTWSDPQKLISFDRFFGPGIWAEVSKYSGEKKIAALKLTTGARPADKPLPEPRKMEEMEDA